jgi:hypothetical protein
MSYEASVSYFNQLDNLEKVRRSGKVLKSLSICDVTILKRLTTARLIAERLISLNSKISKFEATASSGKAY